MSIKSDTFQYFELVLIDCANHYVQICLVFFNRTLRCPWRRINEFIFSSRGGKNHQEVVHKPCGQFFFGLFFDPLLPSWTILLNKAYVVIWIFGKPPSPSMSTWFMDAPQDSLFNQAKKVITRLRFLNALQAGFWVMKKPFPTWVYVVLIKWTRRYKTNKI